MKNNEIFFRERKIPGFQQILRIMKLTIFLILFSVASVFAGKSYSQTKVLNLDMKNSTVKEVLQNIEKQSEFVFMFSEKLIDVNREVTVNIKNQKISDVLDELFAGTDVNYKAKDRFILLTTPEVTGNDLMVQQQPAITGTVTDESGEPLPGVTVVVRGTTRGTVTDGDGEYSLQNVPSDATLVFSFVGMRTQEIEVGNQTSINVEMVVDAIGIEEVVAIGYGTMRKSDLTGSVVRADIEKFREMPNVNIAQSLQGSVPGLNIGAVDESGENPDISIRGATTINGNKDVLIVLDGIIYSGNLSDLNPNDIASIDVLKDASSMAIYGAQAANGVILITTKEGKKTGKPIFNYSGSYTIQNQIESLTRAGRSGFIQKLYDSDWEMSYLPPDYTEPNPDYSVEEDFDRGTPEVLQGVKDGVNYDWWGNLISPGFINSHTLSVSGNEGKTNYFISGGFVDQEGVILNDEFQRITGRINFSNQITNWLKIGTQSFGSFSDYSGDSPNLNTIIEMPPVVKPYNENGELIISPNGTQTTNPYIPTLSDDFDKRNHLFANLFVDIKIPFIKNLNYKINYGHNYSWDRFFNSNRYSGASTAGVASKIYQEQYNWTLDNILNFNKTIATDHNIDITAVYGRREIKFNRTRALGSNYSNLKLSYNNLSLGTVQNIESGGWNESYLYQTARLKYDFKSKYHVTATVRRDGFSGFAKNEKFGLFPSIGLGWVLSEEPFFKNDDYYFKLRLSYGSNGNLVDRYSSLAILNLYSAYVSGDGGSTLIGQKIDKLANPNLSWESTTGVNLGLDFSLIDNRIGGSIDYYDNTTNDLIFNVVIPEITGFGTITSNVGEVANSGFEMILNTTPVKANVLQWDLNFNISSNKNRIKSLLGLDNDGDGIEDDLVASELFIGESINSIYTYETNGIYQINDEIPDGFLVGTNSIVDNNDDGFIDPDDRIIIGREEPAYRFGILNRIQYKNFEFKFFINSIQGGTNGYLARNEPGATLTSVVSPIYKEFDYWIPSNPNADYPRLDKAAGIEYIKYMDRSFVRLQDVSLSYNFESDFLKRIGLNSAKVYISGKNLLTITDWIGWDPETGSGLAFGGRPMMRGYSFGVDFSF